MEREDREEIGERMVTTLLLMNNNREVDIMFLQMTMILFGIALMIKILGEML